jgi:hypothetical protein
MRKPIRGTFDGGASAASGAPRKLRISMTMHPMALHHIVVSSRQPHADLLLSVEAASRWKQAFFLEKCL